MERMGRTGVITLITIIIAHSRGFGYLRIAFAIKFDICFDRILERLLV